MSASPGLTMTVVQADGQDVQPVTVDELRIAAAETYDVLVEPVGDGPYTILCRGDGSQRLRARYTRVAGGPFGAHPGLAAAAVAHQTRRTAASWSIPICGVPNAVTTGACPDGRSNCT
jgi:FtsP/CotA-like multicopper oxidase with cupredoxin domain